MKNQIAATGLFLILMAGTLCVPVLAESDAPAPDASIDLTAIIQTVIALLAALIARHIIPWIKAKSKESQRRQRIAIVRTLVSAAEQIYGAEGGGDKLKWVETELETRGYCVDLDAIEEAVRELPLMGDWLDWIERVPTDDGGPSDEES